MGGGAAWSKDAYVQNELVLHSLKLAVEFLRPGGWFVTKVFRSQDYNALLWVVQKFFRKTEVTKPVASRNTSAEIYFVCQGFLAPKTVDPRLLDPTHVFSNIDERKVVDVLKVKKPPRANRGGYDDDVGLAVFKQSTISAFVDAPEPVLLLSTYNRFVFDEAAQMYLSHAETTPDIQELVQDLKVWFAAVWLVLAGFSDR